MTEVQTGGTKIVWPQGRVMGQQVVIGRRYHVVVRSEEFGHDEYEAVLESIQTLTGGGGTFNVLWFRDPRRASPISSDQRIGLQAAREFTIHRMAEVQDTGWFHERIRLVADYLCQSPEPKPFGELLRASLCKHCGAPVRVIE